MSPNTPESDQHQDAPYATSSEVMIGGAQNSAHLDVLSRVRRYVLLGFGLAVLGILIVIAIFLWVGSAGPEGAGLFGFVMYAGLILIGSLSLFVGLIAAWPSIEIFYRYFMPRRLYRLAALWTVMAIVAVSAPFIVSAYTHIGEIIDSVLREFPLYDFIRVSIMFGGVAAPLIMLSKMTNTPDTPRSARLLRYGVYITVVLIFFGTIVAHNYGVAQRSQRLLSGLYVPSGENEFEFSGLLLSTIESDGPVAVLGGLEQIGDRPYDIELDQARAVGKGIVRQDQSGMCLPAALPTFRAHDNEYECEYAFTTPGGVPIYVDTYGGDIYRHYFFVMEETYFKARIIEKKTNSNVELDATIARLVDDLVKSAPIDAQEARGRGKELVELAKPLGQ